MCVFVYVSECVYKGEAWCKVCICTAKESLELYGKVEAVIRNFLLR